LKVCIVTHKKIYAINNKLFTYGGYFSVLRQFLSNIKEVTLIATGNSNKVLSYNYINKKSNKLGIITLKNVDYFINKLFWQFPLVPQLIKLQRSKHFDLINIQIPSLYKLPIPLILARLFNIPAVLTIYGNWEPLTSKITFFQSLLKSISSIALNISLKLSSGIIAANSDLGGKILSFHYNKPIEIIPDGADLLQFNTSIERITDFSPFILFVGRISKQKGVDFLLKSFLQVKMKHSKLNLVLIGKRSEKYSYSTSILSEIDRSIHFLGYLPQKKVAKYMRSAEIVILPSFTEGSPKVLCEALACGTPVIGTRIAGINEIIVDKLNGILVTPNNIRELTNAIESLLDNKELFHQFSEKSLELIKKKFNLKLNIKNHVKFLQNIVRSKLNSKKITHRGA
jgi:glycosyltransferase involved in cell wall biosynthesis